MSIYNVDRPSIPAHIKREVQVEAGHKCSIKGCIEHTYLEIHHINEDREDNRKANLILLCDKHHKMAHSKVIDRKALRSYKKLLENSFNKNEFIGGQEGDRVNRFQKIITDTLCYIDDCHGVMFVGSETGYYFEQEVYIKLQKFFRDINIYERELRSYDPSVRDIQDQIVELLRQILVIIESENYLHNGSYCAKFIPTSPPATREYNEEIAHQIRLVNEKLLRVQALLSELWSYVEIRIQ